MSSRHLLHLHTRLGVSVLGKSKKRKAHKGSSRSDFARKRDKALQRFIAAYNADSEDPEELHRALDALVIAHTAYTFEWASGPLKW